MVCFMPVLLTALAASLNYYGSHSERLDGEIQF